MDGLDLAVEQQRKRLKELKEQDENIQQEKSDTLRQLDDLKQMADEHSKVLRRRCVSKQSHHLKVDFFLSSLDLDTYL